MYVTKLLTLYLVAMLTMVSTENKTPDHATTSPERQEALQSYGSIVWYTLVTPNLEESINFYRSIFNWEIKLARVNKQKVAVVRFQGQPIASMVEISGADAALWVASVSTNSVQEISSKFSANGGRTIIKPFNIKGTGKQVILEGPLGEKIGFIENPAHPVSQLTNGDKEWIWTELWSTDTDKSRDFYQKVFNASITPNEKTDKPYWMVNKGGQPVAGIIPNPLEGAKSQWAPYVNIQDIPGFFEGLKKTSAKVLLAPTSGYRDGKIVVFEDPHNALVCVQKL